MSRHFLWLPVFLMIGTALYKPVTEAVNKKIETKNISFSVCKGSDYTSAIYNTSTARVHITVEKVSANGKREIVWDKTLGTKYLSQYPSIKTASPQNIIVPGVNVKKEHLEITYVIVYNSDGTELQMQGGGAIPGSENMVNIKI